MISNSKIVNVYSNSSAQRFMAQPTQNSGLPWSAIFNVIVYWFSVDMICNEGQTLYLVGFLTGVKTPKRQFNCCKISDFIQSGIELTF